ncbi:hypothetical protein PHSC3_000671 [Chlamydiales bacterium STE3]|nr:hypothetical protein PHSC3_000671 [Chlamydiales bacterium STE3]
MIFRKAIVFSIICLAISFGFLFWHLGINGTNDKQAYLALTSSSNVRPQTHEPYSAKQKRYKIVKEFFLSGEKQGKRVVRIKCSNSSLFYEQKDNKKAIVERMSNVFCLVQEALFANLENGKKAYKQVNGKYLIQNSDPSLDVSWLEESDCRNIMQIVQCVHSHRATYHYQTQELEAEDVVVERFFIPGNTLPDNFEAFTPQLKSLAKQAVFSFNKDLQFKAYEIEALIYP